MFKRILAIALTVFLSSNTSAGLIGYTLDQSTGVISAPDRGLEWLQWERTVTLSPSQAISERRDEGWRLATSSEVFSLFDDFSLPPINHQYSSNKNQTLSIANESFYLFSSYFGSTFESMSGKSSQAYFGDMDSGGRNLRWAGARHASGKFMTSELYIRAPSFYLSLGSNNAFLGVALVRAIPIPDGSNDDTATSVNEPNSILAFIFSILALFLFRNLTVDSFSKNS